MPLSKLFIHLLLDHAKKCEACADQIAALFPDRKLPTICRECADKCHAVVEAQTQGRPVVQVLEECVRALERLHFNCAGSIHTCIHELKESCEGVLFITRRRLAELVNEESGDIAVAG